MTSSLLLSRNYRWVPLLSPHASVGGHSSYLSFLFVALASPALLVHAEISSVTTFPRPPRRLTWGGSNNPFSPFFACDEVEETGLLPVPAAGRLDDVRSVVAEGMVREGWVRLIS